MQSGERVKALDFATKALSVSVLLLVMIGLAIVVPHLSGWCTAVDSTMQSVRDAAQSAKDSADTAKLVSVETLDLLGTADKFFTHATQTVDLVNQAALKLDPLLDTTTRTVAAVGVTADAMTLATGYLQHEIADVSGALQSSLLGIPPMFAAGERTFTAAADLMSNPDLLGSIGNVNRITKDGADKFHSLLFPPKPDQKWRYFRTAWSILKVPLGLVEPLYYITNIK